MSELKLLFDVYVLINLYCILSFTTLASKMFSVDSPHQEK